jgi:ribose/xylose/arabinose/galactoside ABC-type transport system permease subunit
MEEKAKKVKTPKDRLSTFFASKHFTLLIVIAILIVAFNILSKGGFLAPANYRSIFNGITVTSFFTLGVGMLILFGYIDLSVGLVGSLSGCVLVALVQLSHWNIIPAIIAALAVGCACGLCNALMVNKLRFEPFIATLAMSSVAKGIGYNLVTAEGTPISNTFIQRLGSTRFFNNVLPLTAVIAFVFFIFYGIVLARTKFGRTIYLCGGNKQAARLAGLKPTRLSYILFVNCGFLASVCGLVTISRTGTGFATSLETYQFTGLTAAMLGGIAFGGGSGDMFGCFLGMLILSIFNNGATLLGLDKNIATIFNGLLLVFALALDSVSARRQMKNWIRRSMAENT